MEVVGYGFMAAAWLAGWIAWQPFAAFLLAAVGLGLVLSASALLLEEMSFHPYAQPRQLGALIVAILLENLGYRQLLAWWRLRALLRWATGGSVGWGEMTRTAAWQEAPKA
mgnify:CR=1 FL=1